MSCHDIGKGLSSVVKVILYKLDTGEIGVDSARDLLYACRMGVYWCDGNESEAMIQMHQMRCGYGLKKLSEGETIYNPYYLPYEFKGKHRQELKQLDDKVADTFLCSECFEKLIDEAVPGAGAEQRKYIEENESEDRWHYKDWRRPWEMDD